MTNSSINLIGRIHELADQWLSRELASAGLQGIAPSHGDVLALLLRRGEATMHELAEFAHRTRPTTTVLVAKLERLGLVRHHRSQADARSVVVSLTPQGEALRPAFDAISRKLIAFVGSGLSSKELETLERLLGKVLFGMDNSKQNGEQQ